MTTHPSHRKEELAAKILEIHPEIGAHGIGLALEFDHAERVWSVRLHKGAHELRTHLEKHDADACLEGTRCVHLGLQVAELVANLEGGGSAKK